MARKEPSTFGLHEAGAGDDLPLYCKIKWKICNIF